MKYDDFAWHCGGAFPADLPHSAGATHMAMFVAWGVLNGLAGEVLTTHLPDDLEDLKSRALTPGTWFLQACDGMFTDDDFNSDGNAFALTYYGNDADLLLGPGSFLQDYETVFPAARTLYHVPDTWETFDVIDPVIRRRFDAWRHPRAKGLLRSLFSKS